MIVNIATEFTDILISLIIDLIGELFSPDNVVTVASIVCSFVVHMSLHEVSEMFDQFNQVCCCSLAPFLHLFQCCYCSDSDDQASKEDTTTLQFYMHCYFLHIFKHFSLHFLFSKVFEMMTSV